MSMGRSEKKDFDVNASIIVAFLIVIIILFIIICLRYVKINKMCGGTLSAMELLKNAINGCEFPLMALSVGILLLSLKRKCN